MCVCVCVRSCDSAAEEKIQADDDGLINFDEFRELNRSFPLLLQPAFDLQDHMHEATLGAKVKNGCIS